MKAIQNGNRFNIYDDSMKTYDNLPAQTYNLCFDQKTGFYLEKFADVKVNENVYGCHEEKVNKVLKSFNMFTRSLGVILSGDKGIGKSLFSKLLGQKAIEKGIPLILCNNYYPGIADYVNSISQEVMILFDEFDKTFPSKKDMCPNPQTEMLTVFDGVSMNKKLFVITCNRLYDLNEFLLNRVGRFHYHFRFEYPTDKEIKIYLEDHLDEQYYAEIENVIKFSHRVELNYDSLRGIAFELNCGSTFSEAIQDLNILDVDNPNSCGYSFAVHCEDGTVIKDSGYSRLRLFSSTETTIAIEDESQYYTLYNISFVPIEIDYDEYYKGLIVPLDNNNCVKGQILTREPNDEDETVCYNKYAHLVPKMLVISKIQNESLKYKV